MLQEFWQQLRSGTDIRGVASDLGGQAVRLTDEVVLKIAKGFTLWLAKKTGVSPENLTVAVGHDSRISADRISSVVNRGLSEMGVNVLFCGLASTPSMFFTTMELSAHGAIELTASHHPFDRNGLKFFTKNGGLNSSDITEILTYAQQNCFVSAKTPGEIKACDSMARYAKRLQTMIRAGTGNAQNEKPLTGFKIVVDAGNGAGGFYALAVLAPLGADITGSQFLNPDGMFPNHVPNPEDKEAMAAICNATLQNHADLGVIFDTDVDRAGAVDNKGKEMNRNRLIALAAALALADNEGGTIVTDSITSSGLKTYIEETLGGVHHRYKRGYKNVINEAVRLGQNGINAPLAIETSGHGAFRENYFLDDGAYLVTKIIILMVNLRKENKDLTTLLSSLAEPLEEAEFRFSILSADFKAAGEEIIEGLTNYLENEQGVQKAPDNYEGIRCDFDKENGDGWFLLRLSVHDPIMVLNIESNQKGGVKKIAQKINEYLKLQANLNTETL